MADQLFAGREPGILASIRDLACKGGGSKGGQSPPVDPTHYNHCGEPLAGGG
jgi:hypothetical protein